MDVGLNNRNKLGEVVPEFAEVVFLIEATRNERFSLWQEWSKESMSNIQPLTDEFINEIPQPYRMKVESLNNKVKDFAHTRVDWKPVGAGFSLSIGKIKNEPVYVQFSFDFINGKKICFYECCSRMADYKMVEDWLIERFQLTHDNYSRWNHVNSNNFHNCVNSLDNLDIQPRNTKYKREK